jgi:hypothetical protein
MTLRKSVLFLFITILIFLFQLNFYLPNALATVKSMHCTGPVFVLENALEIQTKFGGCDGGSLLAITFDFLSNNSLSQTSISFLHLWPPGLSLVHFIPIAILNEKIPLLLFYILSYVMIFSVIFATFIFLNRRGLRNLFYSIFVVFFLVTSSPFRGWFFESGLLYQETFAFIFLAIGFILLFNLHKKLDIAKNAFLIGFCFGLASFFRSSIDLFNMSILLVFSGLFLSRFLVNRLSNRAKSYRLKDNPLLWISFGIIFITLPWRIFLGTYVHPGDFSWTTYGNIWVSRWIPSELLIERGVGPWVNSGLNVGCQIDLMKCKEFQDLESIKKAPYDGVSPLDNDFYRFELLDSIVNNPQTFLKNRFTVITSHWYTDNEFNYLEKRNVVEASVFAMLLLGSLFLSIWNSRNKLLVFNQIWIIFVVSSFLPFFIFHVEARYLIFLKLLATFVFFENLKYLRSTSLKNNSSLF